MRIPQLSPEFWDQDPALRHIRLTAWRSTSNPASPDAVLGVCLCRVATMIPPTVLLPNGGSLNYLVALVAPSGVGKTTSKRVAQAMIPELPTALDSVGVGSGEGLIEAYLRRTKNENKEWVKVQYHDSAFFYVDEAETFINANKRESSTTLGTLRSMWTGTDVGQMNATSDTTRILRDGKYRFTCAMGFQPEFAIGLIRDDHAGTPQRFLFVSARDEYVPDVPEMSSFLLEVVPPTAEVVHVDKEIERLIGDRRRRGLRGQLEIDPLDSHRDLMQLKTAYLLSVLCGTTDGVSHKWWNIAGELVDKSREIRAFLLDAGRIQETMERQNKVHQRIEDEDLRDQRRMERVSRNLGKHALSLGPSPRERLINRLAGRDRPYADIDDAVRRGYLIMGKGKNEYCAGPNASAR